MQADAYGSQGRKVERAKLCLCGVGLGGGGGLAGAVTVAVYYVRHWNG